MSHYDKAILLSEPDAVELYREPLFKNVEGRIILQTSRLFQEYLGSVNSEEGTVVSKGKQLKINLNFPGWVPDQEPVLNWFQIALKAENPMLADPLGCKARYKGVLPGYLDIREDEELSEFILEENPRCAPVNYALFIYDRADYKAFLEGVSKLLGGYLDRGRTVVSDALGNRIMVSDDSAQPMLLVPTSLLVGGKEYVVMTWESL